MKIYVTRGKLKGFSIITDERDRASSVDINSISQITTGSEMYNKIQLIFTDGSVTMKAFKQMYLKGMDVYVQVQNMELFMYKMRLYRNISMVLMEDSPMEDTSRKNKYRKINDKFNGDFSIGEQISFNPKIYDGIRTSLLHPKKYLSYERPCHRVVSKLKNGAKSYEELKLEKDEEEALKNLLFSGIVVKTDENFALNEWMN